MEALHLVRLAARPGGGRSRRWRPAVSRRSSPGSPGRRGRACAGDGAEPRRHRRPPGPLAGFGRLRQVLDPVVEPVVAEEGGGARAGRQHGLPVLLGQGGEDRRVPSVRRYRRPCRPGDGGRRHGGAGSRPCCSRSWSSAVGPGGRHPVPLGQGRRPRRAARPADADEIEPAIGFLSGRAPPGQGRGGLGDRWPRSSRSTPAPRRRRSPSADLDAAVGRAGRAGRPGLGRRPATALLGGLLGRATAAEADFSAGCSWATCARAPSRGW